MASSYQRDARERTDDVGIVPADDPRRRLLDRFDADQRSTVANLFLRAVRAGVADPDAVVVDVVRTLTACKSDAQARRNVVEMDRADDLRKGIVDSPPGEAVAFAAWALDWERLPPAERKQAKLARAQEGIRSWMGGQPATPRQAAFLAHLGHQGPVGDRLRASELIDRLLREQPGRSS